MSDSPSVSFADSSRGCLATGYTEDASGVGRANSRVNCFAISLATWSPPIHHGENANLKPRTFPRASSFRNLSSNEVRYKFREREKVKITVPIESDVKPTFDRDFVEVERYFLRYYNLFPCKAKVCTLNEVLRFEVFWFFSSEKNAPAASGPRKSLRRAAPVCTSSTTELD